MVAPDMFELVVRAATYIEKGAVNRLYYLQCNLLRCIFFSYYQKLVGVINILVFIIISIDLCKHFAFILFSNANPHGVVSTAFNVVRTLCPSTDNNIYSLQRVRRCIYINNSLMNGSKKYYYSEDDENNKLDSILSIKTRKILIAK